MVPLSERAPLSDAALALLIHMQCTLVRPHHGTDWKTCANEAAAVFREEGITADMNVGKANMSKREIMEWYAGPDCDCGRRKVVCSKRVVR